MQVIHGTPLPDGDAAPEEPTVLLNEAEEGLFGRIAANMGELVCEPVIDDALKEQKAAQTHLEQAGADGSRRAGAEFELRQARRKLKVAAGVAGPALAWQVEKMLRDAA